MYPHTEQEEQTDYQCSEQVDYLCQEHNQDSQVTQEDQSHTETLEGARLLLQFYNRLIEEGLLDEPRPAHLALVYHQDSHDASCDMCEELCDTCDCINTNY